MKTSRVIVVVATVAGLASLGSTAHADAAAGKATFESVCSECHEAADFEGESAQDLTTTIKGIVAGSHKHKKKLQLTDQQIADVAAYMAAGAK